MIMRGPAPTEQMPLATCCLAAAKSHSHGARLAATCPAKMILRISPKTKTGRGGRDQSLNHESGRTGAGYRAGLHAGVIRPAAPALGGPAPDKSAISRNTPCAPECRGCLPSAQADQYLSLPIQSPCTEMFLSRAT